MVTMLNAGMFQIYLFFILNWFFLLEVSLWMSFVLYMHLRWKCYEGLDGL